MFSNTKHSRWNFRTVLQAHSVFLNSSDGSQVKMFKKDVHLQEYAQMLGGAATPLGSSFT